MNLEKFLSERLTKEELDVLNANSKLQEIEQGKEDNKLTIPKEILDMIDREANGKKILKDNVVKFMRSIKSDLES